MKAKVITKQAVSGLFFPFFRLAEDCPIRKELRVLVYHSVADKLDLDTMGLRVTPEDFRLQMQSLRRWGYQVLDINSIFKARKARKAVILTFDDGYKDFLTNAFPILEEFGYPATVFVAVDYLDQSGSAVEAGYWEKWEKMGWADLKELAKNPKVSVASHALRHRRLTELSQEGLKEELMGSKRLLEDGLGKAVDFFAYPYGFYNQACQDAVRDASYKAAFTGKIGAVNAEAPYSLNRTEISGYDSRPLEFRKKINGSYDWLRYKYIFGRR